MDLQVSETALQVSTGISIEIANLTKRYDEREVLHGLNLAIDPGEFVVIVGRSGCGKSTLLRLVAGLEYATEGSVRLDNQMVSGIHPDLRIMFQDARLLPWRTVIQNVAIGLPPDLHNDALQALHEVGLADRAEEWPTNLSGGQRQRVALARALVHHPRFLLLDEPLGALDALTRIEMQSLIERLWQQYQFTVLLVTHDVTEAVALGDRVVLIEDGAITLDSDIALQRPRLRGTSEFAALEGQVLAKVLGNRAQ